VRHAQALLAALAVALGLTHSETLADTSELSVGVAARGDFAPATTPRTPIDATDLLRGGGELKVALGLTRTLWLSSRLSTALSHTPTDARAPSPCPFNAPCATPRFDIDASATRASLGLSLQPLDDLSPTLWGALGVERVSLSRGALVWERGGERWRGAQGAVMGARWGLVALAGAGVEWRCASRVSVGSGLELSARVSPWEARAPAPLWLSALVWASWNTYAPLF
jgi:hypothetical protein